MDRLKKHMPDSVRDRIDPPKSYAGSSDSRTSIRRTPTEPAEEKGTLGKLKGMVPGRITGFVQRTTGQESHEEEHAVRPITALKDPASFAPPPKHRAAYGDEIAAASISPSRSPASQPWAPPLPPLSERPRPPVSERPSEPRTISMESSNSRPPPPKLPPRLPPRKETFPAGASVTEEDVRERGGLTKAATGALGRLGKSGISIPGFETTSAKPPPHMADRPSIRSINRPDAPAPGTTFEEKKAAINTANALSKDPTKVSFSDARAAASTAKSFQRRHGDQAAAGLSAGKKYGLIPSNSGNTRIDLVHNDRNENALNGGHGIQNAYDSLNGHPSDHSNASPPSYKPQHQPEPPRPIPQLPAKKPPPPLPPKKKPAPPPPPRSAAGPPPIPASSRPPLIPRDSRPSLPATPPTSDMGVPGSLPHCGFPPSRAPRPPKDIDLELGTEWFAKKGVPSILKDSSINSYRCTTTWNRSPSGRIKNSLVGQVLWTETLAVTKFRITWDASSPASTAKAEQRHFPAPPSISKRQLQGLEGYGAQIVNWCQEREGTQVGNGECWTLAHDALEATPGVMASQSCTHGACIFSHFPPGFPVMTEGVPIMPGDVVQFHKAMWRFGNGGWKSAGDPEHTAVVTAARRETLGGWTLQVLQCNIGGDRRVSAGEYRIGEEAGMSEGGVRVFRPVPEDWVVLEDSPTWSD